MAFLAGYGIYIYIYIYITVATDKLVGRMLDNFASKHKVRGHPLLGPFNSYVFKRIQKYCRVGVVANTIRLAIRELKIRRIPPIRWKTPSSWKLVLSENNSVSAYTCASQYTLAYSDRRK